MYVCAGTVKWSLGNKESDFRETRPSFKHMSNSPQLIELLLKENNDEEAHRQYLILLLCNAFQNFVLIYPLMHSVSEISLLVILPFLLV